MRNTIRVMVLASVLSLAAASTAATPVYADNVVDNVGDWMATVGKDGVKKDAILAERKAKRAAKKAEKEARKQAKEAEKAGKDMKKGLGL